MNDIELLRELAQETPLPAPAELDAARARLVAGIATDPATYAKAVAEVTAGQPRPSSGQPAERLRPPAPVLSAGKFMHAGAVSSAAYLIVALPFIGDSKGRVLGHPLTAAPLTITLVIVVGLAVIALWLWMARANGQGRNWARILSTVLFGLATLDLFGVVSQPKTLLGLVFPVLTWLLGLGALVLLWRKQSTAFFQPRTME